MSERISGPHYGGHVHDVSARFREAWTRLRDPATAAPEMLPARLSRACVKVLPVDGAGLSLLNDSFRVPLGESDEEAGLAERLQFTLGEGPCLLAATHGRALALGPDDLREQWPQYAGELFERTGYEAVMSVPLDLSEGTRGALDLFLRDKQQLVSVSLVDAATVADRIVEALELAVTIGESPTPQVYDNEVPRWLLAPSARRREDVWIAMGMVMARHNLSAADALAALRGHAFGNRADIDDVAERLLRGELDAGALAP